MAEMRVTPDGFPVGQVVVFDFERSTRNGNDLVKQCELVVVQKSWTFLLKFLTDGGAERLRVFMGFIERQIEKR